MVPEGSMSWSQATILPLSYPAANPHFLSLGAAVIHWIKQSVAICFHRFASKEFQVTPDGDILLLNITGPTKQEEIE